MPPILLAFFHAAAFVHAAFVARVARFRRNKLVRFVESGKRILLRNDWRCFFCFWLFLIGSRILRLVRHKISDLCAARVSAGIE